MNRVFVVVLALLAITVSSVAAKSTVDEVTISDKNVAISGTTDNAMSQLGVVIIPKSADKTTENVVAIAETVSNKNGAFNVTFRADVEGSLWSDGDYTAYIRINGTENIEKEFYYYSEDGKNGVINDFITKPDKRIDMLNANASGYKTFNAIQIRVDNLVQSQIESFVSKVADELKEDMSEEEFSIVMNKGVLAVLCESNKRDDVLSLMKEVFGDFLSFDEARQEWVCESFIKNSPYGGVGVMDTMYKRANVLYDINYAKHSELRTLITNNAKILGIENENTYIRFAKLTTLESGAVCEKLFNLISNRDVNTSNVLIERLAEAMPSSLTYSGSGGGGSSGGSNNKSNVSGIVSAVIPTPTPMPSNTDQNDNNSFDDIESVSWAKEAIAALNKKNIISGVGDGKFEPNRAVSREEFLAMLVRASGLTAKQGEVVFDDVAKDAWYYEAVKVAYTNGITSGVSDNLFGVGQKITREDMAVMTDRVFGEKLSLENSQTTFSDFANVSDYAKESITRLCENGIISGMEDGTFAPKSETTRAQAAVVLYRVLTESGVDL